MPARRRRSKPDTFTAGEGIDGSAAEYPPRLVDCGCPAQSTGRFSAESRQDGPSDTPHAVSVAVEGGSV